VALEVARAGTGVVLELGMLRRQQRERFYESVRNAGVHLRVHVVDAEREVRRERVLARNREGGKTFSRVVPLEVFEMASDLWEPLESDEAGGLEVSFIRTDG
jgi:predicted kinase